VVIPGWAAAAALVTAVVSYLGWIASLADEFDGPGLVTLVAATVFWLSTMVVVAWLVQRGVNRYRDRRRR
jgi:hypothetical protein